MFGSCAQIEPRFDKELFLRRRCAEGKRRRIVIDICYDMCFFYPQKEFIRRTGVEQQVSYELETISTVARPEDDRPRVVFLKIKGEFFNEDRTAFPSR